MIIYLQTGSLQQHRDITIFNPIYLISFSFLQRRLFLPQQRLSAFLRSNVVYFEGNHGNEIANMVEIGQHIFVNADDVFHVSVFEHVNILEFASQAYTLLMILHWSSHRIWLMYCLFLSNWLTIFSVSFRLYLLKMITSCLSEISLRNLWR